MLSPKESPRGKLLSQYVCVRITRMDDVDIALFERDWNNTLYYFLMNADEQIYMRYGGRDAEKSMTYLDLNSLELALEKGSSSTADIRRVNSRRRSAPSRCFRAQIPPLVERTFARNQCVECHLIGDFNLIIESRPEALNKLTDMYRWPDIRAIGIELDVPKGLIVKEAKDAVQAAGMKPGDRIAALNGTPVWTFGDLQYLLRQSSHGALSRSRSRWIEQASRWPHCRAAATMVADRSAVPAAERRPSRLSSIHVP